MVFPRFILYKSQRLRSTFTFWKCSFLLAVCCRFYIKLHQNMSECNEINSFFSLCTQSRTATSLWKTFIHLNIFNQNQSPSRGDSSTKEKQYVDYKVLHNGIGWLQELKPCLMTHCFTSIREKTKGHSACVSKETQTSELHFDDRRRGNHV